MSEVQLEHRVVKAPILMVADPAMKGFMRSFTMVNIPTHLDRWERENAFRDQAEIPLNRFCRWIEKIAPAWMATKGLTNNQLGHVEIRNVNRHVTAIHVASQIEMSGNDEADAKAKIRSLLNDQLMNWQKKGDLVSQARTYNNELITELRVKLGL